MEAIISLIEEIFCGSSNNNFDSRRPRVYEMVPLLKEEISYATFSFKKE